MSNANKEDTKLDCSLCDRKIEVHPITGWFEGHKADGRCCEGFNTIVVATRISKYITTGR